MSGDTVVLAPAGYLVDPSHGSDFERPWQFARTLSGLGVRVVVVAREVREPDGLGSGVEIELVPGRMPRTPAGQVIDRAALYRQARVVARREVHEGRALAVHHLGPCGPWTPSFVGQLPVPFVYGPVPAPTPRGVWHADEWIVHWLELPPGSRARRRIGSLVFATGRCAGGPLMRRTLRQADAVTVEFAGNRPAERSDAIVIPAAVDVRLFSPAASRDVVAGRIVAAGALLPRKGYDVLLRALALLRRDGIACDLVVAGTGPYERDLRALAERLTVADSVRFAGKLARDELIRLYRSAAAFCHPATFDNYPFAPLEAMACGAAVLVSSLPSLRDACGAVGLVHGVGDHEELAHQLAGVLANPHIQAGMGVASRELAETRHSWAAVGRQYLDLYTSLASCHKSRVAEGRRLGAVAEGIR